MITNAPVTYIRRFALRSYYDLRSVKAWWKRSTVP